MRPERVRLVCPLDDALLYEAPKVLASAEALARASAEAEQAAARHVRDDHGGLAGIAAALRRRDRQLRKDRDSTNRVAKLVPGRGRIYELDRIAVELRVEADQRQETHDYLVRTGSPVDCGCEEPVAGPCDVAAGLRVDAVFLERLAWDLGELRDEIRPRTVAARASIEKGPRP